MSGVDLVTPAAGELVSLDLAKLHCHVDHDDENVLLHAYIAMAIAHVEGFIKSSLLPTVWRYRIDGGFPCEIRLPNGPVLTTDSLQVQYIDDAGALRTVDPSTYQLSLGATGVLRPAYAQTWPSARRQMDAVQVRFTAGWPVDQVPAPIKSGVLLMIGQLYANREPVAFGVSVAEIPHTIRDVLLPHVRW